MKKFIAIAVAVATFGLVACSEAKDEHQKIYDLVEQYQNIPEEMAQWEQPPKGTRTVRFQCEENRMELNSYSPELIYINNQQFNFDVARGEAQLGPYSFKVVPKQSLPYDIFINGKKCESIDTEERYKDYIFSQINKEAKGLNNFEKRVINLMIREGISREYAIKIVERNLGQ